MERKIKISRPASGSGTVVTVTLSENGVTVSYAYRSVGTNVSDALKVCDEMALTMLMQARAFVDGDVEVAA